MLNISMAAALLSTFFFGIFTVLVLCSTYSVLSAGICSRGNLPKVLLTLTMYAISCVHLGIGLRTFDLSGGAAQPTALRQAWMYLPIVNYILSDAVVVWRCWLLWSRRSKILVVPILMLMGNVAAAISIAVCDVKTVVFSPTFSDDSSSTVGFYAGDTIVWALSLGTNVWATVMVAYKAWQHRRHVRALFHGGTRRTQAEKLMALLVESGALYCIIWVIFLIPAVDTGYNGNLFMSAVMPQIAGIYPTVLIVLVNFGKTQFESNFAYEGNSPSTAETSRQLRTGMLEVVRMGRSFIARDIEGDDDELEGEGDSSAHEIEEEKRSVCTV